MDVSDIRKKYPMYSDLSDEQLLKGFHDKFYSDMPYEDFRKKFSFATPAPATRPTTEMTSKIIPKGRQIQSLPKTLAYGGQFQRAPATGGLGDIESGAIEAGGRVTDVTGSPALGTAVRMIPDVATSFGGMGTGAEVGKAVAPALKAAGESLLQSSLKPSLEALKSGKAAKAIQTMFDEGINVSKAGLAKLKDKIYELNDQIKEVIKNSPATVDKGKVAAALHETLDRFIKTVNPKSDLKTIEDAWSEFLSHPLLSGKKDIPVKLAQDMKQATYREVDKKYGELGSAAVESQKALARGLKEEISKAVPEVASLNKRESDLLNALSLVEKRALLEGNKNYGGFAWLAHNKAAWAAYMADKSAAFKSVVARIAYKQAEKIPKSVGETIGAAVGSEKGIEKVVGVE